MSELPKIPGQEIERAVANVGEYASKGLADQFMRMLGDFWAVDSAKHRAKAKEIKANRAHYGAIQRYRIENAVRRDEELAEIAHEANKIERLREAAHFRLLRDLYSEQKRIEEIATVALEYKDGFGSQQGERSLDDDWLFKFFRYAGQVEEATVLDVLSRALAEAATLGKPKISNRALDTLRFFDLEMKRDFEFIASQIAVLGFLHREHDFGDREDHEQRRYAAEYPNLFECGLLKTNKIRQLNFDFGEFDFLFSFEASTKYEFETVELTQLGSEIFGLFDNRYRELTAARRTGDLQNFLKGQEEFGLSNTFARMVGDKTVSATADSDDLGITAFQRVSGVKVTLFDEMRHPGGGCYDISKRLSHLNVASISPFTASFVSAFENYDRRASGIISSRARD